MTMPGATLAIGDHLTGAQKCAVLCMALGPETSSKFLQLLSVDEVEQITLEIASLRKVDYEAADKVLKEYQEVARAAQKLAAGGVEYARAILEDSLGGERANLVLKRIQEQLVNSGLRRLRKAPPELLHSIFRGEHPQTIALILSNLDPAQAAIVVESMDPELAGDVLHRVARMEKVSPEMVQVVEAALGSKADLSLSEQMTKSGGPQTVANVLNHASAAIEKQMLESIAERSQELADEIKNLMFVFEDMTSLDNKSIQRVLREIDARDLALALKAVSEEVKKHIIKNMSERASAALLEEMEFMGPVRVKDVQDAQSKIIGTVRTLEETGEIMIADRSGDDFIT
jgi:flagellar motor switch protein FliG